MIVFGLHHRKLIDACPKGERSWSPSAAIAERVGAPSHTRTVAGYLRTMERKGWVRSRRSGGHKVWQPTPEGRHLAALEKMRRESLSRD